MRNVCQQCDNWNHLKDMGGVEEGQCRRRSPMNIIENRMDGHTLTHTEWPITLWDDWCGEWRSKRVTIPSAVRGAILAKEGSIGGE